MTHTLGASRKAGTTGTSGKFTNTISIDFTSQATLMKPGSTAFIFMSYDSMNDLVATSDPGPILIDGDSAQWIDSSSPAGSPEYIPQYASLWYTVSPDLLKSKIVFKINGIPDALPGDPGATPPINWRAILVVIDDKSDTPETVPSGQVIFYDSGQSYPAADPGEKKAALLFISRSLAVTKPPALNSGSATNWDSPVASVTTVQSITKIPGTVDIQHLQALRWEDDAGLITGGPWLAIKVFVQDQDYVPPAIPGVTPPTNADDFWALPACCQCADVFLINDDTLASQWDVEGSSALIDGETLLLNYTDPDGTRWSLTDIEGWWTLPPPDLPDMKRAGYLDGSYPVDGRYDARVFTVSGTFLPGPGINVAVPRQRLLRALDAVRGGALFVAKEPVWAKQAWVYLADQPKIDTKDGSQRTEFEFTLKAVDPIKYHAGTEGVVLEDIVSPADKYLRRGYFPFPSGTFPESDVTNTKGTPIFEAPWTAALPDGQRIWPASGAFTEEETLRGTRYQFPHDTKLADVPIDASTMYAPNMYRRYQDVVEVAGTMIMNAGTAIVYPRFYMYGPMENPVITNLTTSQTMRFSGVIPSGQVLVADCYWRIITLRGAGEPPDPAATGDLGGLNRRWMLDFSSEWIGLVPGENILAMSASSVGEGAHVTVYFRSGWMG